MALYSYIRRHRQTRLKAFLSFLSICFIFIGIGILSWVLLPILAFEFVYASKFDDLIRPVPDENLKLAAIGQGVSNFISSSDTDYTKASVWFPQAVSIRLASSASSYTLSIPKLHIEQAKVTVGEEDLNKSLIHFTGPLPGNYGNPVIFGHSTIPWLYNPKDYASIFSKLPDLDKGDDIYVTVDNVTYRYQITNMKIINPDDLSVLQQQYDNYYITLVTCVPPGTYLKRLVVKGVLQKI